MASAEEENTSVPRFYYNSPSTKTDARPNERTCVCVSVRRRPAAACIQGAWSASAPRTLTVERPTRPSERTWYTHGAL